MRVFQQFCQFSWCWIHTVKEFLLAHRSLDISLILIVGHMSIWIYFLCLSAIVYVTIHGVDWTSLVCSCSWHLDILDCNLSRDIFQSQSIVPMKHSIVVESMGDHKVNFYHWVMTFHLVAYHCLLIKLCLLRTSLPLSQFLLVLSMT